MSRINPRLKKKRTHLHSSDLPVEAADHDPLSQFRSLEKVKSPVFPGIIFSDVSFLYLGDDVLQVLGVNSDAIFSSIRHQQTVSLIQSIVSNKPTRRLRYPP